MPPTRGRDELTAKQKATVHMTTTAGWLVFFLSIRGFMVPLSKGNFLLRGVAFCWLIITIMLIPINLLTFVYFVYHFHGASIRRTIGFFCLWGAISYGLWNYSKAA